MDATRTTTSTATTTTHGHDHRHGTIERNHKSFRGAFLSPLLWFIGSILVLIGACLNVAAQPRNFRSLYPGDFKAAAILFIVGHAIWILAALVGVVAAHAETANLRYAGAPGAATGANTTGTHTTGAHNSTAGHGPYGETPGVVHHHRTSAWLAFIATILLLIGSAIWLGATTDITTAGSILWLIGYSLLLLAFLLSFGLALTIGTVVALMTHLNPRYRAWHSMQAHAILVAGSLLFVVGACAFILVTGEGFWHYASLLWIVASSLYIIAWYIHMKATYSHFTPVYSFLGTGITAATAPTMPMEPVKPMPAQAPPAAVPVQSTAVTAPVATTGNAASDGVQVAV
jgi:hypothetical protein